MYHIKLKTIIWAFLSIAVPLMAVAEEANFKFNKDGYTNSKMTKTAFAKKMTAFYNSSDIPRTSELVKQLETKKSCIVKVKTAGNEKFNSKELFAKCKNSVLIF